MSYVQISGLYFMMKGEADTEHDRKKKMMLAVPFLKTKSVHDCFLHDEKGGI